MPGGVAGAPPTMEAPYADRERFVDWCFCRALQIRRAERFAPCPPAFGLLLDLRKPHSPTDLAGSDVSTALD